MSEKTKNISRHAEHMGNIIEEISHATYELVEPAFALALRGFWRATRLNRK